MKKTLITLAALAMASVASAAVVTQGQASVTSKHDTTTSLDSTDAYTQANGAFTMTLVLDWDKVAELSDATQVLYSARNDATWGDVCYTKVNLKSDGVTLLEGPSNSTTLELGENNVRDGKAVVTYTFAGGDSKALTLYALDASTGTLTSTTLTTGWSVTNPFDRLTIDIADGVVERAIVFDTALSSNEVLALSNSVIPEPTTATLSLLALAGLAARRRRK